MTDKPIPKVPVEGKPHLVRYEGQWAVAVGSQGAARMHARMALEHAKVLEKIWRDMNMVEPQPPQNMEFSERRDPTSWGGTPDV